MLVHICHSVSFTYKMHSHKEQNAPQTDADGKSQEMPFSNQLSVVRTNSGQLRDSDECILHRTTCWLRLRIENLRNV